jgi:hypothetical protein
MTEVTHYIGPCERYTIILGHCTYAIATGIIVFVTNCLLSILSNVRDFCGAMLDVPVNTSNQIDTNNNIYTQRYELAPDQLPVEEPKPEEHP